jgi:rod shape-determining protein MreC
VIARPPTPYAQDVVVAAGSDDGVRVNDPVVTGDGLVGRVTQTTRSTAEVTLITDHTSAVSAKVMPNGPEGVVEPEAGDPSALLLDFINSDQKIHQGQLVVTAGWSSGSISSAYPYGLRIGQVTQTTASGQQTAERIRLRAFADLRGTDYVEVLTHGPRRPGVGR